MPDHRTPGVDVEGMPGGSMPLTAAGTAVAAFVGFTAKAPTGDRFDEHHQRSVTSWEQYERLYGGLTDDALLPHAVKGFFGNGGGTCHIVRIPDRGSVRGELSAADSTDGLVEFINGLTIADDVTMVVMPDLWTVAKSGTVDGDGEHGYDSDMWDALQHAVIARCQAERRMAILDSPPGLDVRGVSEWRERAGFDSAFATLYYPWLQVDEPAGADGAPKMFLPPSGHIAGIWSRTDTTRGVWKAPANEGVLGVLDAQQGITAEEQAELNAAGINAIRAFGSSGLKVWGARTLSSDPSWRYINVRRLFDMIETSILNGTDWVVVEPNDRTLWERVSGLVDAFLLGLWREGALFGTTPDEAYSVRCDAELNPPASIDEGKLIIEVGVAPIEPAEFVVFRLCLKAIGRAT